MGPTEIRSFVIDTLQVSGCSYREVDDHLLLAEVTVEIPPMFFDPPRLEKHTLNLVFEPEAVRKYPGAELVTQGSFRLNWFVEGLKERGRYTLQSISYELNPRRIQREILKILDLSVPDFFFHQPFYRIHPHLMVNYILSFQTDEIREELVSLGLDMVTGEIVEGMLAHLKDVALIPKIPKEKIEKQSFSLEEGFNRLHRRLAEMVEEKDPSWVEESRKRYEEELFCLYQYYKEGKEIQSPEFKSRAEELFHKFRPRVLIRPVNVGLLYLPEILYTVHARKGPDLPPLRYRPVLKKVEWSV